MNDVQRLSEAELDRNDDAFKSALPGLIEAYRGKFAIVRDATVSGIYETLLDAHKAGWRAFHDERFSVQEINDQPVCLGIYSYAYDFRET